MSKKNLSINILDISPMHLGLQRHWGVYMVKLDFLGDFRAVLNRLQLGLVCPVNIFRTVMSKNGWRHKPLLFFRFRYPALKVNIRFSLVDWKFIRRQTEASQQALDQEAF